MMTDRALVTVWAVAVILFLPSFGSAAATLELYGTFHAMGVIVDLGAGDDSDLNAVAVVSYRTNGDAYAEGLPLVRTSATRFVGSLFWLDPGTTYDVRVGFVDPGDVLDGQTLDLSTSTRADIVIPTASVSYYASPAGGGSTCLMGTPCALVTALNLVGAGEEVVLRGGTYSVGGLGFQRSGTAGAPIVLRAFDGETPVLDGDDPATFSWSSTGGGVYQTSVNVADTHLVTADGERLYPYQTLADLQNLVWSIPGFYVSGTTVSVRLMADADPNAASMVVSRFNTAFTVNHDLIYIIGLTFRHYGQGSYAKAVYLDTASDCVVSSCTFTTCDLGVGIKRESHRNVIENNTFSDTLFNWPWDAVKAGARLETGGVRMYDPMTGRGTIIRGNTFFDDFDGFGVCPDSDTGTTCETDVYDNLGYELGDDGFETDGYCANVRIWNNTFHDLLVGVSLAPVYTGPVYALRNLIYNTGRGNNSYGGTCFKLNSGYATSGAMFLYHNTCDAALPGNDGLAIKSPGSWTGLVSRNNIWAATAYAVSNSNASQPVDLDHDNLFTTMPGELAWWSGLGHLRTLNELQVATGQELNGMTADPGYAAGGFSLDPLSDLVDVGLLIPGVNHGFSGAGPDIGAFEVTGLIFADGFESAGFGSWTLSGP